ncbi:MAG: ribosome-associated translation inhibitor RaiA [Leptotrichia wadei]|jgi:probable sigma(54) modulation protein|uniref:Ribosome hibernation promoting factor n=2 Tax=Leptotrichia TaxID=32067 RepID=A0A510KVD0_9FUSO|nr:ribosome-associated translation inhibitor RaiA [Leptotrichia wadei]MBS6018585.1 ribosome-associated translation inhibitor RaiA [Leptotrichia wadei]BBM55207.1 sigma 54 modulation protein/30S ribosomalprotein S30EA [Leptotrichia wadei]VTX50182.1 Ribosome hibernation promotion factor [uncultured Leptotrichia sp.]
MKIIISGKQLKVTDAIKTYTEEKISRISKYSDAITEIDVVLTVEDTKSEGPVHKADGLVFASGTKIKIEAENKDLYAAIDDLSDRLERQVRKYKEKQKDHNKKGTRQS